MNQRALTRAAVGAAAAAAFLPLAACTDQSDDGAGSSSTTPSAPSPSSTSSTGSASSSPTGAGGGEYVDGTYTARGVYGGAPSYMDFTMTLDDGAITDVESELMPDNNDTSRGYQERFAAALPDEVVGMSIADLEVGVIAGASGCADGFNDALDKIREQAADQ